MARSPDYPYKHRLDDIVGELRRDKILPETGWYKVGASDLDVPFQNSWENAGVVAGVTNAPASWYLSEDGETRLRGKVVGGAVGTVVFTLPEEVRPEFGQTFICPTDDDGEIDLSTIKYRAWGDGDAP